MSAAVTLWYLQQANVQRQIIGGAEPLVKVKKGMKPLSIAVEEMYKGEVTILPESEVEAEEETKEEPVIE